MVQVLVNNIILVGHIIVIPEESEDMWHLFHLIAVGDQIQATTIRKIQKENSTGTVSNDRVKLMLAISVENVDFDPAGGTLRVSGKNLDDNKFIKVFNFKIIIFLLVRTISHD